MNNTTRLLQSLTAFTLFTILTSISHGAGFALQEQSFSGLGTGFAAGAAQGEDNSSMAFNAATLTLHQAPQATTGFHYVAPEAEYEDTNTVTAFSPDSPGVPNQGPDDTSKESAFVPNLYYSHPLSEKVVLGAGLSVPFGLATDYQEDWVGRYVALNSDLEVINGNLAIGFKISDAVSVGGGLNIMRGDAVLSNALNFGLLFLNQFEAGQIPSNQETQALAQDVQANLGTSKYDGISKLEGDDVAYGFNFGIMITPNDQLRIGLSYRSKVELNLEGDADFTVGALESIFGDTFVDQGGKVDLELPDITQASVHYQVTPDWAIMGDIQHTGWSSFKELDIRFDGGLPNSYVPEEWEDVWRYSVGSSFQLNEAWTLRGGLVWDESPVPNDQMRSPRIPDEDRFWVAVGFGFQATQNLTIDAGYVHIFVEDPQIDNFSHTQGEYMRGSFDADVNILSLGATYRF